LTRDFKLSRAGEFYDLRKDIEEKNPLKVVSLEGEAAEAVKLLQGVLDKYKGARPAELVRLFDETDKDTPKKKKKKSAKK